jgi:hypothetical protein
MEVTEVLRTHWDGTSKWGKPTNIDQPNPGDFRKFQGKKNGKLLK